MCLFLCMCVCVCVGVRMYVCDHGMLCIRVRVIIVNIKNKSIGNFGFSIPSERKVMASGLFFKTLFTWKSVEFREARISPRETERVRERETEEDRVRLSEYSRRHIPSVFSSK